VRDSAEQNQRVAAQTALGHVGLPVDIGGAMALLLTPESSWMKRDSKHGWRALAYEPPIGILSSHSVSRY
jgi:hypothetical protein